MERVVNDLRLAFRMLRHQPSVSAIIVITLALGIGAASSIFSVVNAVLIKPLPYSNIDRLVAIDGTFLTLDMDHLGASPPEFIEYRELTKSYDGIAAFNNVNFNLTGGDQPERVVGARFTPGLLPLLGARPAAGSAFDEQAASPDHANIAILSAGLARRRFGSIAGAVSQSLALDGSAYTVIGVMPDGFEFPHPDLQFAQRADLYVPLSFTPDQLQDRSSYSLRVLARLKPDVSLEQARAEMTAVASSFVNQYPESYLGPGGKDGGWRITVSPLTEQISDRVRPALLILMCAGALLALIACANTANILLARAVGRNREIAVRIALGASRAAVMRQLLTESTVLALAGGGLGLLAAVWSRDLIVAISSSRIPRVSEIGMDWRVALFTLMVSILTALIFGIAPALHTSGTNISEALRDGAWLGGKSTRRQESFRGLLVAGEIAVSLMLLAWAGLLTNSLVRLKQVNAGFNARNVLTMEIDLPPGKYSKSRQRLAFFEEVEHRVASLPEVKSAGLISILPMSGGRFDGPFSIEGRPFDPARLSSADYRAISPEFFDTMQVRLKTGRWFDKQTAGASAPPAVIINERFADDFFAQENPIGKRIKLGAPGSPRPWLSIVGVCEDVKERDLSAAPRPAMYVSMLQEPARVMALAVRTEKYPVQMATAVREIIHAVDADQPVTNVRTMEEVVSASASGARFNSVLSSVFAAVALLLAAVGTFGVISHSVSQRTREIGIRMALGAERADVLRLIVRQGLTLTLIGLALGLAGTFATTPLLSKLLYGVGPNDPATLVSISVLLAATAIAASLIPARRASKVDPIIALKE